MIHVKSVDVRCSAALLVTRADHNTSTRLNISQLGLPTPGGINKQYTPVSPTAGRHQR